MKVYINSKAVSLSKNNYKASGGEGVVYCRGKTAYKIYNDPARMIPPVKIKELQEIQCPNVLAPRDLIFSGKKNRPIGFTMPYIADTEFFCKLFTGSFRQRKGISPEMIIGIVTKMQETLALIHKKKFLVVDFNEFNFLVDKTFSVPYFIDVNSYQTRSFPATAIMDSIRDRQAAGKFSELSDWFSFAVVTFQLYTGCHPYKGKHPGYSAKETISLKMMDDNVSVFHPDVRMPANSRNLSLIPRAHLKWYERVFRDGERSIPPPASGKFIVPAAVPKVIKTTAGFLVKKLAEFQEPVQAVNFFDGVRYLCTNKHHFKGNNKLCGLDPNESEIYLSRVDGGDPVIAAYYCDLQKAVFTETNGTVINTVHAEQAMGFNGTVYTTSNGKLFQHGFSKFKSVTHIPVPVCSIFEPSFRVFPGLVVQDIFSKCWLAVPYADRACANIHIKELDGLRIYDAGLASAGPVHVCIVLTEKDGLYQRYSFLFNRDCSSYSFRVDSCGIDTVNLVLLNNGLCVTAVNEAGLEAFFDTGKVKVIHNFPFDSSVKLVCDGNRVMIIAENKLYHISLEK